ncbi:hypothetical protein HYV98_00005 [Candidatus Azambacteria bacterium]|nr:hypothetical protein [Candidatus Azambacteria bacterium]
MVQVAVGGIAYLLGNGPVAPAVAALPAAVMAVIFAGACVTEDAALTAFAAAFAALAAGLAVALAKTSVVASAVALAVACAALAAVTTRNAQKKEGTTESSFVLFLTALPLGVGMVAGGAMLLWKKRGAASTSSLHQG